MPNKIDDVGAMPLPMGCGGMPECCRKVARISGLFGLILNKNKSVAFTLPKNKAVAEKIRKLPRKHLTSAEFYGIIL